MGGSATAVVAALITLLLSACDQNMGHQAKYHDFESAPLFSDDQAVQVPPPGTVARGDPVGPVARPALTAALLDRGRERFNIFCSPCHGLVGNGEGMIVQRGMPHPPNFHSDRLRNAPDEHFFEVITNGYGAMYSYAARVPPADRWAIIAYIRALQLSQHAELDALPADLQAAFRKAEP